MEDPPIHADMVKATEADTVLGRFGETSEFAAVLAFPASDEGRWITAQVIEASTRCDWSLSCCRTGGSLRVSELTRAVGSGRNNQTLH